ncbi:ATP-dependent DNA helicase Q5 [Fasciola gigantica]|uniref:ATP-dependent DNA helicase Q5 n=1 Tax=Fasciola gigantica TaxID=46835 RepID=A0A504YC34_FASGI|nr:ATP-dependent DNA helicase Q5 [Fasciola gigantica]
MKHIVCRNGDTTFDRLICTLEKRERLFFRQFRVLPLPLRQLPEFRLTSSKTYNWELGMITNKRVQGLKNSNAEFLEKTYFTMSSFADLLENPYDEVFRFAHMSFLGWVSLHRMEIPRFWYHILSHAIRVRNNGLTAFFPRLPTRAYHAGLKKEDRENVQSDWSSGTVPVVAATISFGMGVDKPNVRSVH